MNGYGTQSTTPQMGRNALANVGRGVRQGPTNFRGREALPNWGPTPSTMQNNARPGQVADRMFSGQPLGGPVPPPGAAPVNPYQQPTNGVAGSPTGPSKVPFPWPVQKAPMGGGQAMPGTGGMSPYNPYANQVPSGLQRGQAQASFGGAKVKDPVTQTVDDMAGWVNRGNDQAAGDVRGKIDDITGWLQRNGGESTIPGGGGGGGGSNWMTQAFDFINPSGGLPGSGGKGSPASFYQDLLNAITGGSNNDPYGAMAKGMSDADIRLWKDSMGDYAKSYDDAMSQFGRDGRAEAREADRQKMLAGIQEQTDRALQYAQGQAGRGGAVGTATMPGIYQGAQKAAAAGEMQAAQDAWGRMLTGEQARTGLAGDMMSRLQDSLTTRKELLAATLEAASPGGFLQHLLGLSD